MREIGEHKPLTLGAGTYLGRVGVDDTDVGRTTRTLQHDFLHVLPNNLKAVAKKILLDDLHEKLLDVAEQLLRDALARGIDAELDAGGGENHGGCEHAHADRLAEAPRRADEHLLREVVPPVVEEDLAVVARKLAFGCRLPEDARAGFLWKGTVALLVGI